MLTKQRKSLPIVSVKKWIMCNANNFYSLLVLKERAISECSIVVSDTEWLIYIYIYIYISFCT